MQMSSNTFPVRTSRICQYKEFTDMFQQLHYIVYVQTYSTVVEQGGYWYLKRFFFFWLSAKLRTKKKNKGQIAVINWTKESQKNKEKKHRVTVLRNFEVADKAYCPCVCVALAGFFRAFAGFGKGNCVPRK